MREPSESQSPFEPEWVPFPFFLHSELLQSLYAILSWPDNPPPSQV